MRVLITGSRSYAALEMARHFKGAGWEVYAADCVRFPVCRGSRAVTQSFLLPSPRQDLRGFVDGLIRIIKQYRIDLLMPSSEEIFYIASGIRSSISFLLKSYHVLPAMESYPIKSKTYVKTKGFTSLH